VAALAALEAGTLATRPQSGEGVTYAKKIEKAETRIDWDLPAAQVHNHIRGLSPFPGAWCEVEISGRLERLKVLRSHLEEASGQPGDVVDDQLAVACATGAIRLVE